MIRPPGSAVILQTPVSTKSSHGSPLARILAWTLGLAALGNQGCGSIGNWVQPGRVPPNVPAEVRANTNGMEVALTGIVIYNGPGTWKSRAYWDEYVVRLENHRSSEVVFTEFVLRDILNRGSLSGSEPESLELRGRRNVEFLGKLTPLAANHGERAGQYAAGAAGGYLLSALWIPGVAPVAAGGALLYGAPLIVAGAVPYYLVRTVIRSAEKSPDCVAEFERRRLKLPYTLAPGATATGSVFFPLTPGPARLLVYGQGEESPFELVVDLTGWEELHLRYTADPAALQKAVAGN